MATPVLHIRLPLYEALHEAWTTALRLPSWRLSISSSNAGWRSSTLSKASRAAFSTAKSARQADSAPQASKLSVTGGIYRMLFCLRATISQTGYAAAFWDSGTQLGVVSGFATFE